MKFEKLFSIINKRKETLPRNSYVSSLIKAGEDKILQKIGEEATEVVIAAKGKNKRRIIEEIADLFFMSLIFLAFRNIPLEKVYQELDKRRKE